MKLCKNVLLESVERSFASINIWVCANVNRENTSLFFSFEPDLSCQTFKTFCKTLGLAQGRTRKLILEQLP